MSYAIKTKVSVGNSQSEIRKTLSKYKATAFAFGEQNNQAVVQFEMSNRRIRFNLPLPIAGKEKDKNGYIISQNGIEQLERSRWRCLLLCIKGKLESVESGITTLEQEFMAHIVLPNGSTVSDVVLPEIAAAYENKKMPLMLGIR